jgi:hypothetical protein
MGSQYPPSPRVEDEESALKNEIAHKSEENKTEAEEARCRGSVNQYPIILDVNHTAEPKHDYTSSTDNEGESIRTQSSDDSFGPPTPPNSTSSRNHVQFGSSTSRSRSGKATPTINVAKEPKEEATPRGRPNMPRIQTDLGSDLQGMITGNRRAPSPYAYTKPNAPAKPVSSKRFSGSTFLSPEQLAPSQSFPIGDSKRPSSARPRSRPRMRSDSDDSSDSAGRRRRHHSRRRSTRETFGRPLHEESLKDPAVGEKRTSYYTYPRPAEHVPTPPRPEPKISPPLETVERQSKRTSRDSPYTSSAEESWSRSRSDFVSRSDKRLSKDSPYTSPAEEGRSHRRDTLRVKELDGRRSHRGSVSQKERPRLDLTGHQYSYHGAPTEERHGSGKHGKHSRPVLDGRSYLEPSSLRSPKAMEDYLEKAFKEPKGRAYKESPHPSPGGSPGGSPPRSPPRTPKSDRRSKDYFSLNMTAADETPRSRTTSRSEAQHTDVKPLAGVLAAAAGTRAIPPLSRSSTSSTDPHPSSNPSKPASGRRSRNTSPIREEITLPSRGSREHDRPIPKVRRDDDRPDSRPVSRAGSTAHNPPPSATFDRFNVRSGSYAAPHMEIPRLNQRAFSYSGTDESQHLRQPSSAKLTQLQFGPPLTPNQTGSPLTPRLPRSPPSSEKAPRVFDLTNLPICPRSVPEAGHHDWHTAVGIPQLDICPTCMTVVGASRFRDLFVPSPSKIPGQKIMCDFSRPWVRNAWVQIIKQRRGSLDMIYQIIHNSETTKPCPGKGSDVRAWYRLPDPDTGINVPNFDACSECVRSIEIIFPQLRGIFKRGGALVQERTCDLNTQSRRFERYLKLLDAAATEYDVERLREPDIQPFANFARKTARIRECTRDDMVMNQLWHFIPGLPEFTVCEECFDQVVWPVVDQPVASSVNRTLQLVPGAQRNTGISCQLYSERMRKRFLEAVRYADFEYLKQVALRRHGVERLLQEKHKTLMNDMANGKDRTEELKANIEEWRKWE